LHPTPIAKAVKCLTSGSDTPVYDVARHESERERMQITVVAVVCHTLGAVVPQSIDTLPDPVCREVIVIQSDMSLQSCMLSQPALADWKGRSIYSSDQWRISRIKCVPGDYVPKARI
jgi:hypothetical protein